MTVLVDTGVLYADHDRDASRHDAASGSLEAVYDGEFGTPYISDYVFDEALTLARRRMDHDAVTRLQHRLRGIDEYPATYELLFVSPPVFTDGLSVFERYHDQALSFTDATSIALLHRHDLDAILSFDDDFDGIVGRIEPGDV